MPLSPNIDTKSLQLRNHTRLTPETSYIYLQFPSRFFAEKLKQTLDVNMIHGYIFSVGIYCTPRSILINQEGAAK